MRISTGSKRQQTHRPVALGHLCRIIGSCVETVGRAPRRVVHCMRGLPAGTLEAALGVALLSIGGLTSPRHWGLLGLQPHPLWLVVLAIAIRYGIPAGYVAGALAALSYAIFLYVPPTAFSIAAGPSGTFPPFHLHMDVAAPLPLPAHALLHPALLLIGGVVVSELMQPYRRHLAGLAQECQEARDALVRVTQAYLATAEVNAELEKRVLGQATSVRALYQMATRLSALEPAVLYPAIVTLVREALEAECCALYLSRGQELRLQVGQPADWPGRASIHGAEEGLIGQALRTQRVVTNRDRLDQAEASAGIRDGATGAAMMAGPLLDSSGEVLGIVVIERLPFLKLNQGSVQLFSLILQWASTALCNARRYQAQLSSGL